MKANHYTVAEAEEALKGKRFHYHEAITGYYVNFIVRSVRRCIDDTKKFIIEGRNEQRLVSAPVLVSLLRYGRCRRNDDTFGITCK